MFRFALPALIAASAMALPAEGAVITRAYQFTGTNVQATFGSAPPPVSTVKLRFSVAFDPALPAGGNIGQAAGATLISSNIALGSTFAFAYFPNQNQRMAIGGLANGVFGISVNNSDFTLDFNNALAPAPTTSVFQFATAQTPGSAFRAFGTSLVAVPEPATWALMIAGFGLTGGAMRRTRRIAALNPT